MKMREKVTIALTFLALSVSLSLFAWSSLVNFLQNKGREPLPVVSAQTFKTPETAELLTSIPVSTEANSTQLQDSGESLRAQQSTAQQNKQITGCKNGQGIIESAENSTAGIPGPDCQSLEISTQAKAESKDSTASSGSNKLYREVKGIISNVLSPF